MGRVSTGVRGMRLDEDGQDEVVGMIVVNDPINETVMVVSQRVTESAHRLRTID